MSSIKEKVAFLKGLASGLDIDNSTKDGKMLLGIVDVLEAMADEVQSIGELENELIDSIDEMGARILDDDEDEDEDDKYDGYYENYNNFSKGNFDRFGDDEDDADEDEDDEYDDDYINSIIGDISDDSSDFDIHSEYEASDLSLTCPSCHENIDFYVSDIDNKGMIKCPFCGEKIEVDIDDEDDE